MFSSEKIIKREAQVKRGKIYPGPYKESQKTRGSFANQQSSREFTDRSSPSETLVHAAAFETSTTPPLSEYQSEAMLMTNLNMSEGGCSWNI